MDPIDLDAFSCPRCDAQVSETYYGPCASCRREMVDHFGQARGGEARTVEAAAYEPKMNVTPNAVALKD